MFNQEHTNHNRFSQFMANTTKTKPERATVSITIKRELLDHIRAVSAAEHRNISQQVELFIEERLTANEEAGK